MPKTLILGYGNSLRGDDAAGRVTAERLQALVQHPDIEVRSLHQLTPELMADIAAVDHLILIDASETGRAGRYMRVPVRPAPPCASFTHHATPEALLSGARSLYGRCPDAVLYLIPGQSFEPADTLTAPVKLAVDRLADHLADSLK